VTKIGAGGKFDKDSYRFLEVWCWCFCCKCIINHLRATVHSSDGKIYEQEYEKGKALYPVKQIGEKRQEEQL
jgi:DNA gyrase subunit B